MTDEEKKPLASGQIFELIEELNYLRFFYSECDFGPAHEDCVCIINSAYIKETGKHPPEAYATGEY